MICAFLSEGLVDDLVLTVTPALFGRGTHLFGAIPRDIDLELVASRSLLSGFVQSTYRVA